MSDQGRPLRLVIVDDNEINILAMSEYFRGHGCQLDTFTSGAVFLQELARLQPDLVLLDIQMPDINGLEVLRRLRAVPDKKLAATPVIALTALAMPGDRDRCLEAGANEYVTKPAVLRDLVKMIRTLARPSS